MYKNDVYELCLLMMYECFSYLEAQLKECATVKDEEEEDKTLATCKGQLCIIYALR